MATLQKITSDRLLLRAIESSDAPFFFKLFNSEGWLKYIGDRNIKTIADAEKQIIEKYIPSYSTNGYGSYLVEEIATGAAVGTCGIYKRANLDHPDIGFAFLPQYTGKGYGYESATVVMEHARKYLKLKTILAFTVAHNTPSIGLLEKLGLQNKGEYFYEDDPKPLLLFSTA